MLSIKRFNKLELILSALTGGNNVQNRQLHRWLTEDEYGEFEQEWCEQVEIRAELKDKPQAVRQYEHKLKEAIMMGNRSEAYARKGNKSAAYKCSAQSERLCEGALEILQEIVHADASIQIWFDRALDFSAGSQIDASLGNLPRVVTSRSIDKQNGDMRLQSKLEVKIAAVERAIDALSDSKNQEEADRKMKDALQALLSQID
jgi:hypothetical protein